MNKLLAKLGIMQAQVLALLTKLGQGEDLEERKLAAGHFEGDGHDHGEDRDVAAAWLDKLAEERNKRPTGMRSWRGRMNEENRDVVAAWMDK